MTDVNQQMYLRDALSYNHARTYHTNPFFHSVIDTLAQTLPLWVEALAEEAVRQEATQQALLEALEKSVPKWEPPDWKNNPEDDPVRHQRL